jgi:DNA-binding Xre family transcriptional regulator
MKFCEAVDRTISEFNLVAKELAQQADLTSAQLSEFRHGKRDIHARALERLIAALPSQAQQYLFFECLLSEMDDKAIGTLLYAISLKMREPDPMQHLEQLSA